MAESEMVERVAEALWNAASVRAADRPRLVKWMDEAEETRDVWRHGARAAIEAMWPPTDDMIRAASDSGAFDNGVFQVPDFQIEYAISCAIRAALEGPAVEIDMSDAVPSPAGEGR